MSVPQTALAASKTWSQKLRMLGQKAHARALRAVGAARRGWPVPEDLTERALRLGEQSVRIEKLHAAKRVLNPLPRNVPRADILPADAGWFGYSFRDVPNRQSAETIIACLTDCAIVGARNERGVFEPAIVAADNRVIALPQSQFRASHLPLLHTPPRHVEAAVWFVERAYDNYAHWLTAHLPKLLLLRERGELRNVLLPRTLHANLRESLAAAGLDNQAAFIPFDEGQPIAVKTLTVISSDRFRPELLCSVRDSLGPVPAFPRRKVFISRAKARGRQLLNEDAVWEMLCGAGYERVFAEDLTFREQRRIMSETRVLVGPHGAGLTNMMFCPAGAHVIEIMDASYPNPNFYALACAMGHHYWMLPADAHGSGRALDRSLRVSIAAIEAVIAEVGSET